MLPFLFCMPARTAAVARKEKFFSGILPCRGEEGAWRPVPLRTGRGSSLENAPGLIKTVSDV